MFKPAKSAIFSKYCFFGWRECLRRTPKNSTFANCLLLRYRARASNHAIKLHFRRYFGWKYFHFYEQRDLCNTFKYTFSALHELLSNATQRVMSRSGRHQFCHLTITISMYWIQFMCVCVSGWTKMTRFTSFRLCSEIAAIASLCHRQQTNIDLFLFFKGLQSNDGDEKMSHTMSAYLFGRLLLSTTIRNIGWQSAEHIINENKYWGDKKHTHTQWMR